MGKDGTRIRDREWDHETRIGRLGFSPLFFVPRLAYAASADPSLSSVPATPSRVTKNRPR